VTSTLDVNPPDAEAPLPAGTTRADFYSGLFCISADVFTGDRRLLDVLRDVTRSYLEVRRMGVSPIDEHTQPEWYADGLLNKAEIAWIAVRAEPSRAEGRLYGFVKKAPVRVALVLATHCLEGNVFVDNHATDPTSFFLRGADKSNERFVAVASAAIRSVAGSSDEVGLAIVNRTAIRAFTVLR
jgi:hypothetical protein